MTMYSVHYGKREEVFEIPADYRVNIIGSNPTRPVADMKAGVLAALAAPVGSPPFRQVFGPGDKVVIVVSDVTRLWVRSDVLVPILLDELNAAGVPDADVAVVFATGDHRSQTVEEHRLIVGDEVLRRVRVYDHDCQAADLVDLGRSRRGTAILLNRMVYEAPKLILTGGISYHLLAGFGGGRKSVAPGVAGYATIQENHGLALKAGPGEIGAGVTAGNPVAEDMDEICALAAPDFLLNVVVNENKDFIGIVAGHWREAHAAGTKVVEEAFAVPIRERADVVVASCGGYPKDIQLYQSIKALDNADYAAKDGGAIILVSECFDGPGPEAFLSWFRHGTYAAMSAALHENFTMPGFVALRTRQILESKTVYLVSGLAAETAARVGMKPAASVAAALAEALPAGGGLVHVMPHGTLTFPQLE
ncbi:nickel-dependent lactate racemase [Anaeroselena agilis]|uniref:Nickel-dependent lactate racemase n=1 Tax=Anaeroselena agilis TaxID=3063788 RepID=A0ABU3NZX0_9FIRM|nr:nickel-dependent lactate racemase [Selenomonadales bacterium 4137-cl]